MNAVNRPYDHHATTSLPPRDVEAAAFEFVNRSLRDATGGNDRVLALSRNRKLWTLLLTDVGMTGNALPPIVKQDVVSLGSWSIDYSIKAMLHPLDLTPLVSINQDMIDGLRAAPARAPDGPLPPHTPATRLHPLSA